MLGYILSTILLRSLYEAIIFSIFANIIQIIIHRFCTEVLINVITFFIIQCLSANFQDYFHSLS